MDKRKDERKKGREETQDKLRERRLRQKFREMDKIIVRKEHVIIIYTFGFQPQSILCILEKSLSCHLKNDGQHGIFEVGSKCSISI